jgi:hypothetical protein
MLCSATVPRCANTKARKIPVTRIVNLCVALPVNLTPIDHLVCRVLFKAAFYSIWIDCFQKNISVGVFPSTVGMAVNVG